MICAEDFIPPAFLSRNKGYENRLQPLYENNNPDALRWGC